LPKISYIETDGTRKDVDAKIGQSVMEAAIRSGVEGLAAECGGACSCATCHVYVSDEWIGRVPPASEIELEMLEIAENLRPNSRLSCQIMTTAELDGLLVEIALA
jgi:2Fe-2S ferredoxin